MHSRRTLLATAALAGLSGPGVAAARSGAWFEVELDEAEWRRRLAPDRFEVLRKHATERAGSSPLDREKRRGLFHCAGCDRPLFDAAAKYDSGTGWPSFRAPIEGAVGTSTDRSFLWQTRTEVHCSRCGGHLGHVFDDGPPPAGKRYCMNGLAMTFRPADGSRPPQS
jgi:peptide-methionine (R)-S-oxide reductase